MYFNYLFLLFNSNFISFWVMLYNTVFRLPSYKVFLGKAIFILRQNREKSKKIPCQFKENQEPDIFKKIKIVIYNSLFVFQKLKLNIFNHVPQCNRLVFNFESQKNSLLKLQAMAFLLLTREANNGLQLFSNDHSYFHNILF